MLPYFFFFFFPQSGMFYFSLRKTVRKGRANITPQEAARAAASGTLSSEAVKLKHPTPHRGVKSTIICATQPTKRKNSEEVLTMSRSMGWKTADVVPFVPSWPWGGLEEAQRF